MPRRWIVVAGTLFALSLGAQFGGNYLLDSIRKNWIPDGDKLNSRLASFIDQKIESRMNEMRAQAERIRGRLVQYHPNAEDSAFARKSLQRSLSADDEQSAFSIAVFDSAGFAFAYNGEFLLPDTGAPDGFSVLRNGPYLLMSYSKRLASKERIRVSFVMSATVPVGNRFIKDKGFVDALEQEFATNVEFFPPALSSIPQDGRYLYVPVVANGDTAGVCRALKYTPETQAARFGSYIGTTLAALHLALLLNLLIMVLIWVHRRLNDGWKLVAVAASLWMFRAGLLYLEIGKRLLPEDLLNPVYFASSFGFGIASSLGELTISSMVLAANLAFAALIAAKTNIVLTEKKWRAALIANILLLLNLAILVAFLAVLKSFVFDASFNYDDIASVTADTTLLLMYINIALVGLSFGAAFFMLGTAAKLHFDFFRKRSSRWVNALLFFVVTAAFITLALISGFPGPFPLFPLVALILTSAIGNEPSPQASYWRGWKLLMLWLGVTVSVTGALHHYMEERRREEIQAIAADLTKPFDAWASFLVQQTVQTAEPLAAPQDGRQAVPDYQTAFSLWANSPLREVANNSGIVIIGQDGTMRTQFTLGIDPTVSLEAIVDSIRVFADGEPHRFEFTTPAGIKQFYASWDQLPAQRGWPEEYAAVAIVEGSDPLIQARETVELLRALPERESIAPEDNTAYSMFRGSILVGSSNARAPRGYVMPPWVADSLDMGAPYVWHNMPVNRETRKTLFARYPSERDTLYLAISAGRSETLIDAYRYLRLAFIVLLVGGAFYLALGAVQIGRIPRWNALPYRTQLRLLFLAASALPILLAWVSSREIVRSNVDTETRLRVREDLRVIATSVQSLALSKEPSPDPIRTLTDIDCHRLRAATGKEVNVYAGTTLAGSSRPEFYRTGVFPSIVHPFAYYLLAYEGMDAATTSEKIGGLSYYIGWRAIRDDWGRLTAVVSTPTLFAASRSEETYVRASASLFIWLAIIVVIVSLLGHLYAVRFAEQLQSLISAARRVAKGDYHVKVSGGGSAEVAELGTSFNVMTEQLLHSRDELAAAERTVAWNEMARQVAHEIRNPLTPMRLAVQHLLHAWRENTANVGDLVGRVGKTLLEQIDRLAGISEEFARFARLPRRNPEPVHLVPLLEAVVNLYQHHETITCTLTAEPDLPPVFADPRELSAVFTNVVRNAVQALPHGGEIRVGAARAVGTIRITVQDTGQGIPGDVLPRIFEPNFSTKTEGMGLGLAIVKRMLDDADGTIAIESEEGKGTTVIITLPLGEGERHS